MTCDHSAPHSGVSRYHRASAELRLALVCDRCGEEQSELGSIEYRPHSRHVSADLAALTARELGLDEQQTKRVRYAMLICDVGADQISAAIFNKPGSLTTDERREVQRQPELGAAMLTDCSLADVREWIAARRERPDGTGYPKGLRAAEIPLEARILAVVEAYVAMISTRPYRGAMHQALALRELLDNAGRQFDTAVVTAFVRARPRELSPVHSPVHSATNADLPSHPAPRQLMRAEPTPRRHGPSRALAA